MQSTSLSSVHYLSKGFSLIWKPGIRAYVFIPLLINLILLTTATIYAFDSISNWYTELQNSEYTLVKWTVEILDWILWPLIMISVLIVVFFIFAFIANWIAAPFNGLLSEAVERHLSGQNFQSAPFSLKDFMIDIPRLLGREWRKFVYYFPRALGCLILFVTPLALLAPIIWFLFNAWMATIQYIDYPMDNHKVPFNQMLKAIKTRRSISFGFGALAMLFTMIPIVNILVMPVAVAGGTALWFDQYKDQACD